MLTKYLVRAGLVLAAGLAFSSVASAQATRTWVSGVGDDVNPCSRTAPCKTFAGAISKTAANGEISVLDPGGYGGVTITKSMTIDGGGFVSSALVSGTNGIVVNGAGVAVVLRNIQLTGLNTGLDGVRFLQGNSLLLDNVRIQQFNGSGGDGVEFAPNSAVTSTARLTIVNSVITQNGGTNGFGVLVKPTGSARAEVVLDHVQGQHNRVGVRAEANSTVTISNSNFSNNTVDGVNAAVNAQVNLENVVASNNGAAGVKTEGPVVNGPMVLMTNGAVFGNTTGLSNVGGQFISFGNNRVAGNDVDGAFNANLVQK
jgi:hypothetical protein